MPSQALQTFERYLLIDVNRIIESHAQLSHDGRGRRGLGHITRSGIFMLCAAWESYLEDLVEEAAGMLKDRAGSPDDLPETVQKEIVRFVTNHKHELKALELAAEGWRVLYEEHVSSEAGKLNTPKSRQINALFYRLIGVADLSDCWSVGAEEIDDFVQIRGGIAHRGNDTPYVTINSLNQSVDMIIQTVTETDNYIAEFIRNNSEGNMPWNRRYLE